MSITLIVIIVVALALAAFATYKAPRLTSVILWAMVASVFLSAALILVLPGDIRTRVFWFGMCLPITWVALQFWCYFDERQWRVVAGLLGIIVFGAVAVVLLAPAV